MLCHVIPCYIMSVHVMSYHITSHRAITSYQVLNQHEHRIENNSLQQHACATFRVMLNQCNKHAHTHACGMKQWVWCAVHICVMWCDKPVLNSKITIYTKFKFNNEKRSLEWNQQYSRFRKFTTTTKYIFYTHMILLVSLKRIHFYVKLQLCEILI